MPIQVNFLTGEVIGHYSSGTNYDAYSDRIATLYFGASDQKIFIESLKSELIRHNIAKIIVNESHPSTLNVLVHFVKTEHFLTSQKHKISATLQMNAGDRVAEKAYSIETFAGESLLAELYNNAEISKNKVANKLMSEIIKDILHFMNEK